MQYKIPIQIENEDPIVFWLSLRQLIILFAGMWVAYATYSSLEPVIWVNAAAFPSIIFVLISLWIALFKYSEMTFMLFLFTILRSWVNWWERSWQKWVDSFSALDIWFIVDNKNRKEKIDFWDKMDKIKNIEELIEKI